MTQGNDKSSLPAIEGLRVICEIGRSPRGVTYKARRLLEQDLVAVKVFDAALSRDAKFRERLDRNAGLAFLLEHRAMVRTLGVFQDGEKLCLMMEYAPGEPLTRALQRNVRFGPERAVAIAMRIGSALSYAWRHGYVHGRLHPGDVIVTAEQVSVLGIALGEELELPPAGTQIAEESGRFNPLIYAAPELLKGHGATAGAEYLCDLYSLGAILYHMLTGFPPFKAAAIDAFVGNGVPPVLAWPRDMQSKLPRNAVCLVERLMARDPSGRGTFDTLAEGLKLALQEIRGIRSAVSAQVSEPPPILPPVEPLHARSAAAQVQAREAKVCMDAARPLPPAAGASHEAAWDQAFEGNKAFRRLPAPSWGLVLATSVVFAMAMFVAGKLYIPGWRERSEGPPAGTERAGGLADAGGGNPRIGGADAGMPGGSAAGGERAEDEERLASRRLAQIKEVVESGRVSDVRPVLGVLDDLIHQYPTTKASVMAAIYRNQLAAKAGPGDPDAPGSERSNKAEADRQDRPGKIPTSASAGREASEMFASLVKRADSLAAELRFGEAISALRELPSPLMASPFLEEAKKHAEAIEKDAAATYARMSLEAETATLKGRPDIAREIYAKISDRFGLKEYKEAAERRLAAMAKADDDRAAAEQKKRIEAAMARETEEFGNLLLSVAARARAFRYDECIRDLEIFADGAGGGENVAIAKAYAEAIKAERWLYNRARARIRDGKAPLQVFPKKGAPGQDIKDFNERGLVIGSGGAEGEIRWASIPDAQVFNLFKFALDVPSSEEHMALAVFAWHREMKDDVANEIRAAVALDPKLKDRADKLSSGLATLSDRLAAAKAAAARLK